MQTVPVEDNRCVMCESRDGEVMASGWDYQYKTTPQNFDWLRCRSCGHYYVNPLPTKEALGSIYPSNLKNYGEFDSRPGLAFRIKSYLDGRRLEALTRHIPEGGRLLDVGCAAGMLLDSVKRSCPNINVLEGLEISRAAAVGARRKGYRTYISTIEDAELPEGYYDVIMMQQVIEHVHDPRRVIAKLYRALRPGGMLVMETPHLNSWDHRAFSRGYWEGYHIPRHFNLWQTDGMKQLVDEAGFSNFSFNKRIKPVHWTFSLQNWAIATGKPKWVVNFFGVRNFVLLALFGMVDVLQMTLAGKASDVQYIGTK